MFRGHAGEKKPRILPGEERGTVSSENSKQYLLFQENVSIFVFSPKHLLPGDGKWKTDHTLRWLNIILTQHRRMGWEQELRSAWTSTAPFWQAHFGKLFLVDRAD